MRLYQKILLVLQKPGEGDKGRQSQSRRPGLEGVQARSEAPKAEPVEALQLYKSQQRPQGRVTEGSCWLESPPPRGMDGLTTATRVKRAGEGQPPGGSRGPPDPENISVCPQAALWPPWVLGTADPPRVHTLTPACKAPHGGLPDHILLPPPSSLTPAPPTIAAPPKAGGSHLKALALALLPAWGSSPKFSLGLGLPLPITQLSVYRL